jgi:hypothetical protein
VTSHLIGKLQPVWHLLFLRSNNPTNDHPLLEFLFSFDLIQNLQQLSGKLHTSPALPPPNCFFTKSKPFKKVPLVNTTDLDRISNPREVHSFYFSVFNNQTFDFLDRNQDLVPSTSFSTPQQNAYGHFERGDHTQDP